jgi:hypothetical protein
LIVPTDTRVEAARTLPFCSTVRKFDISTRITYVPGGMAVKRKFPLPSVWSTREDAVRSFTAVTVAPGMA